MEKQRSKTRKQKNQHSSRSLGNEMLEGSLSGQIENQYNDFWSRSAAVSSAQKHEANQGQATLEAAYLIPIIFVLLLLLIQPGILLYDRMIMQAAANEGCRLLATKTDMAGVSDEAYRAYILRRLGAIPPQDQFHIHASGCTWEIEMRGDETSAQVGVTIKNQAKLLPLFDMGATALGLVNEEGSFELEVSADTPSQPDWVATSEYGLDPEAWIRKWS